MTQRKHQSRKVTRSRRWRAGSRKNKRNREVGTFASDLHKQKEA